MSSVPLKPQAAALRTSVTQFVSSKSRQMPYVRFQLRTLGVHLIRIPQNPSVGGSVKKLLLLQEVQESLRGGAGNGC